MWLAESGLTETFTRYLVTHLVDHSLRLLICQLQAWQVIVTSWALSTDRCRRRHPLFNDGRWRRSRLYDSRGLLLAGAFFGCVLEAVADVFYHAKNLVELLLVSIHLVLDSVVLVGTRHQVAFLDVLFHLNKLRWNLQVVADPFEAVQPFDLSTELLGVTRSPHLGNLVRILLHEERVVLAHLHDGLLEHLHVLFESRLYMHRVWQVGLQQRALHRRWMLRWHLMDGPLSGFLQAVPL